MLAVLVAATAVGAADVPLKLDVSVSPFTATPEPLTVCAGVAPLRALELDGCGGLATGHAAFTAHAFLRTHLIQPELRYRGFELAVGAGAGARANRTCSAFACAYSAGPEGLLSVEGTLWFSERFGAALQADGGVALQWLEAAPGVIRHAWRFPLRALLGVSFLW